MLAEDLTDEARLARDQELRRKLGALYSRDQFEIHERVLAFYEALKSRYSCYREYRLVHLISGSTIGPTYFRDDFPGEDSIAAFIDREYLRVFGTAV